METTQIIERMKQMKLFGMYRYYQSSLDANHQGNYTPDELLNALIESEWDERQTRKIDRLMRTARFRYKASVEEITFNEQRNLDKDKILRFAECDFIKQKQNILITGSTGVGKSYLACALAHRACLEGYKVRYYRVSRLFRDLHAAQGDGTYLKLMTSISKFQVLVIDDWGLENLKDQQRNDLLEVLEDRHGVRSTIITSQLPVEHWHEVIGNPTIADAIMDRVVHNAHKINLSGDSMRKKKAS
jgi:DNA replication protein DnaC